LKYIKLTSKQNHLYLSVSEQKIDLCKANPAISGHGNSWT